MKVTTGKLFSVATDIKHIKHPLVNKAPIKSGKSRALGIFIFAVAGVLTAGIVPVFYLATAYKKIKALPNDANHLVEKTNTKGNELISKGKNTPSTPANSTENRTDNLASERSRNSTIQAPPSDSRSSQIDALSSPATNSQAGIAIPILSQEDKPTIIPLTNQNSTEKSKLAWPENPTSATDLNMILYQASTDEEKEQLVATAPLALIKTLLQKNFFNDPILLWDRMLPYLSDQHLKELSLTDFANELQMGITIIGRKNITLQGTKKMQGPSSDHFNIPRDSINGPIILAESRRRFSLLASGSEVKNAIEKKQLSRIWLGYLNSKELSSAYSFKELVDKQLIEDAFPFSLTATESQYKPEEKLRFSQFSPSEIQTYMEQFKAERSWLSGHDENQLVKEHLIWKEFEYLLSKEQILALNFKTLNLAQLALVINNENWEEIYRDLNIVQKEAIFTPVKKLADSGIIQPFKCLGVIALGNKWGQETNRMA